MNKCFFKVCCFLLGIGSALFAESAFEFSLASIYNEPSVFVEGKVNAITGEFFCVEEDLVIQGVEPIRIQRVYLNSSRKDWILLPHIHSIVDFSADYSRCTITDNNGCAIVYKKVSESKKEGYPILRFEPSNLEEGFSNTSSRKISSRTNLKNNYVIVDLRHFQLTLHTSEGVEKIYERRRRKHDAKVGESWRLLSEHLPNGNWLLYDYEKINDSHEGPIFTISSIRSMNPSKTKQYAQAVFKHEDPKGKNKHFFIEGSDGQRLEYRFEVHHDRQSGYLNAILSDACRPDQFYEHCKYHSNDDLWQFDRHERMISAIIYPQNRRLKLDYYFKSKETVDGKKIKMNDQKIPVVKSNIKGFDVIPDFRRGKVKTLSAPLGPQGEMVALHTFLYDRENKSTIVYDADKHWIQYHYDDQMRIARLERYSKDGTLRNVEQFVWGKQGSSDACNLVCKIFLDEHRKPLYAKRFFYDQRSNLKQEKSYGNLSGKGTALTLDQEGFPVENGVEIHSKEWRYSEGEPSLLLESKTQEGLCTTYEYLPGTNIISSQLTYANGAIQSRKYWEYNDDHLLIREVIDDGSNSNVKDRTGVTVQTIRDFTLRQQELYWGMPEIIEEKYWDGSTERLLQKTVLHYAKAGFIEQKDIYDSNGRFRYSQFEIRDEKGRIKRETNALNWTAYSDSDENGNRIYYKDYSGKVETFSSYDLGNRLIRETRKGIEGTEQTFRYEYNTQNVLTSEIDPQGHETKYTLTPFGRRAKIHLPTVPNEQGTLISPVLRAEYDASGNEINRFDEEGHETKINYNAYGSPIEIIYPDGSKETYEYFLDGTLKTYTDQIGVVSAYERDVFGQVTRKMIHFNHLVLADEIFRYKGRRKIAEVNAEAHRTTYGYDGAGRKISEEYDGEKTTFTYDELGRNNIIEKGDLRIVYEFDLLGRIEEQREEDILTNQWLRKTVYHHDVMGNQTAAFHWINEQNTQTCEQSEYDFQNRLICRIDQAGQKQTIFYKDDFRNEHSQRVLQKTHTDPMGLETVETFDAHGRLAQIEKRKNGNTISQEKRLYNARGKIASQIDTIFTLEGSSQCCTREISTKWEYDSLGRLIKLTEAEGTAEAKITRFTYTLRGEKETTTKPDGNVLNYGYNGLGDLELITSSDQTVHHQMRYNKLGVLIWSDGLVRNVDGRGRILSETFPEGLSIQNRYNQTGQRTTCSIPQADCLIEYSYNGLDMMRVSRRTLLENELYSHTYSNRDLSGNQLQSNLPAHLGPVQFSYDPCSRRTAISAPLFTQEVLESDKLGNICRLRTQNDESQFTYNDLYQLTSERGPFNHDYQCDSLYCRLQKNCEIYHPNSLNQVVGVMEYDKRGNPIKQGDILYAFDALDRMIRIETPHLTQSYSYDSQNRRLSSTTFQNGEQKTRYYLYDGQNEIGAFDESLAPLELRILGEIAHAEIGAAVAIELQGVPYTPIHDLFGNVAALLPLNVSRPTLYRYSAFGEETIDGPAKCPWRFSSKRVDETGLVNYGRRFYQPELGRWLSPDPARFADGMNLYAFLHNNPLTHFDEYGLLDLGQWDDDDDDDDYEENNQQFGLGIAGGLVDAGFGAARVVNTICHAIAAPFHCYDYKSGNFNFSLGSSHSSINSWLDGNHHLINHQFLSHADHLSSHYKFGSFIGNSVVDGVIGGALLKGAIGLGRKGLSFGRNWMGSSPSCRLTERALKKNYGGWIFPEDGGGALINNRWYTEHALERMAPNTPQVMAQLEARMLVRAQSKGLRPRTKEFGDWLIDNSPNPRGIPPSVVEAEISKSGSTGVRVFLNQSGDVITVIPRK